MFDQVGPIKPSCDRYTWKYILCNLEQLAVLVWIKQRGSISLICSHDNLWGNLYIISYLLGHNFAPAWGRNNVLIDDGTTKASNLDSFFLYYWDLSHFAKVQLHFYVDTDKFDYKLTYYETNPSS